MTEHSQPRSAGTLHIGQVHFSDGIFSADMTFVCAGPAIDEDDLKSATLAVTKNFKALLQRNGFWDYGKPELKVEQKDNRTLYILVACRTKAGLPKAMKLAGFNDTAKH